MLELVDAADIELVELVDSDDGELDDVLWKAVDGELELVDSDDGELDEVDEDD